MSEAKVKIGAIAFGLVLLGAVSLVPLLRGTRFTHVEQRLIRKKEGPFGTGPGVLLSLDMTGVGEHLVSNYQMRLWDERGRELPITPLLVPVANEYLIPLGYAEPIVRPRLEAWLAGKKVAEAVLRPFPPPLNVPLVAQRDAAYHLRREPSYPPEPQTTAFVLQATHPSNRDTITIGRLLRTDHATDLPDQTFSRLMGSGTAVPYGDRADFAEVQIESYRVRKQSEDVPLPRLPLRQIGGETRAVVERKTKVPNHLGCDLELPVQPVNSMRPSKTDHRIVSIDLNLPLFDQSVPAYDQTFFSAEIVSPKPEAVGLKALALGNVGRTAKLVQGSVPGSLNVVVRLTRQEYIRLRTETKVLRIEEGPSSPVARRHLRMGSPAQIQGAGPGLLRDEDQAHIHAPGLPSHSGGAAVR